MGAVGQAEKVKPDSERVPIRGAASGVGTTLLRLGGVTGLKTHRVVSASQYALVPELGSMPVNCKNDDFVEGIRNLTRDSVDVDLFLLRGRVRLDLIALYVAAICWSLFLSI